MDCVSHCLVKGSVSPAAEVCEFQVSGDKLTLCTETPGDTGRVDLKWRYT
jgi:hypothetical protein